MTLMLHLPAAAAASACASRHQSSGLAMAACQLCWPCACLVALAAPAAPTPQNEARQQCQQQNNTNYYNWHNNCYMALSRLLLGCLCFCRALYSSLTIRRPRCRLCAG